MITLNIRLRRVHPRVRRAWQPLDVPKNRLITKGARRAKGQCLPTASWVELLATALRGRGLDLAYVVDSPQAQSAWFAAELEPEVAANLDKVDAALARWIATLTSTTRVTYTGNLRRFAAALGFEGPRPVRAMLDAAAADPASIDAQLQRFMKETDWKAGTVRSVFSALHQATLELVRAKLAVRAVARQRPHYDAATVRSATRGDVEAIDASLRSVAGPIAARTRVTLHLAWCAGLSPRELLELQHDNVHLEGRVLILGTESVPLDVHAMDALRGWLAHRERTEGPLLIALDGKSHRRTNGVVGTRELQRSFSKAARAAGVNVTLSGVRNGAVLLAASEGDRRTAQRLAGTDDRGLVNRLIRHA
jgi:integrase